MVEVDKAKKEKMDCHGNKLLRNDKGDNKAEIATPVARNDKGGIKPAFVDKYNLGGRPKAFNSPQEMMEQMTAYFDGKVSVVIGHTKDGTPIYGQGPINIQGMCAFMGITNQTLNEYAKDNKYKAIIAQAKMICEGHLVDLCCSSKDHKADFVLKNNYKEDWKDETSTKLITDEPTAERLKKFLNKNKGKKASKKEKD